METTNVERRVSPALGDFALQERGKLMAENARLRIVLSEAQSMRLMLLATMQYVPEPVLAYCNKARAALAERTA